MLGADHTLTSADGWKALEHAVRRRPSDVAVVDPGADGTVKTAEIVSLVRHYPSLPVLVYTVLSPQTMRAVVELSGHGVNQVILHRFDDEPRRLLETLEQQPGVTLSDALLDRLAVPLAVLPAALVRAVEQLFRRPLGFSGADDLARVAAMPLRTLYRVLEAAGLASPSTMVRAARLLRAYAYLRDSGHSVEDVAVKLGYSSRQLFGRHVREAFGVAPIDLRRRVAPQECVTRLSALLTTRGA
ncbi:MAG TPA: helix-turn-helix transcriptional regulator, partial [Gemmatimonadaceae bacterium]|nr:helix-turn-helix transcriptional regulator [Gemmatimonadaceae bacterium]